MSALATIPENVVQNRTMLAQMLDALSEIDEIGDLHEVRARAEAVKAWAKVHGHVKSVRLDLLRVETEALVRIVELGGIDTLPARDRRAAQYLADMSQEERAAFVAASGSATTVTGMCRSVWAEEELTQRRHAMRQAGMKLAEEPTGPMTDGEVDQARSHVVDVAAVLSNIVSDYTDAGEPFSVSDMSDRLIQDARIGQYAHDPELKRGVNEVCREAIRRAPVLHVGGTALPRMVTARDGEGIFTRIPVANATLAHMDDMIELRREQLEQDRMALDRLVDVVERLRGMKGASPTSRVGDLVAQSVVSHD